MLVLNEYPLLVSPLERTVVGRVIGSGIDAPILLSHLMASVPSSTSKRLRWLDGVLGADGERPHLSADGRAIELTTADHHQQHLAFDQLSALVQRPAPRLVEPARTVVAQPKRLEVDENGLFTYVDAHGSTNVIQGLRNVPAKYRGSAEPVDAEIESSEALAVRPDDTAFPLSPQPMGTAPSLTPNVVVQTPSSPGKIFGLPDGPPGAYGAVPRGWSGGIVDSEGKVHHRIEAGKLGQRR